MQIAVLATSWTIAAVVPVGLGSYSDQLPSGLVYPTDGNGAAIAPAKTSKVTGAIPTNDWASSLVFQRTAGKPHPYPMFPHPWSVQADTSGLRLGFASGVATGAAFYAYGTPWDIAVGVPGQSNAATLLDTATDWTVRASLYAGSLQATFGHGLAYVYIEHSGSIELKLAGTPVVLSNQGASLVFSLGDRNYAAYAPTGASWTVAGTKVAVNLGVNGYLAIAVLPDQTVATRDLFAQHAYAFVTGTRVEWAYDSTNGASAATYSLTTTVKQGVEALPLIALYPHQWRQAQSLDLTGQSYQTPRGTMKLAATNSFTTLTPVPGVFPIIPFAAPKDTRYQASTMTALVQTWAQKTDDQLVRRHADTYWTGKDLGRLAILTQLAEAAGMSTEKVRFLTLLQSTLENWMTYTPGETSECFAHESTWGSLIGLQASYGSGEELNDHHFHYGYYLMAAATVARMVPGWGAPTAWGGMVDLVAREAANPDRGSSFSPFLRNFDPYAGHSWASGHANFGDGNNQESSSESLNFSAGLLMWGQASGNKVLRNLGTYLYATEVQAVREYWFDVYNQNFPAAWSKMTAGMIWGSKVDHATWFSADPEMIHGINWLPLTGASLYLDMDGDYAGKNYAEMVSENGGDPDQWVDVAWGYRAFSDNADAWRMYSANPSYTPEDGESQPHIYAHILSMGALGALDTAIRGDLPTSAVFQKGNVLTYYVYNPGSETRTVHFTNGVTVIAPAQSWANSDGTGVVNPVGILSHTNSYIQHSVGAMRSYDLLGRKK